MSEISGYKIAGILYLVSVLLGIVLASQFSIFQIGLGLALVLMQDQTKLDVLRLIVFAWIIIGLVIVLIGAVSEGSWGTVVPTVLFGGAIAGLMLEDLTQKKSFYWP